MKKFNLMQILPSLQSGGVEQGTIDVANFLASLEIKNHITSNGGQMLIDLNKRYIEHNSLPVHSKNFFKAPFTAKQINDIIKKQDINILHFRSRAPAWLLPYINKQKIKTISTFHNVYGNQNFIKKIYNKQLSKVDKIVAISNYVKHEIINIYKIKSDKITVINRGIDTNFFNSVIDNENSFNRFLGENHINTNKKIVLFPGRLTGWKGQLEFLKIIEYFKEDPIIFYFVGDNKNKSYEKQLIKEINIKNLNNNCRILGHLKKDELKMMYKCSNIIISAPLRPEGFGRVISEALSMKKIILAYNFGGATDQLKDLDDLYRVKPQDHDEMKFRISAFLKLESDKVLSMGDMARKHVIKKFSMDGMLNSYLSFYQEL
jgi:glycosyltransferase involved in cell wall biosynthesis